MSTSDLALPCLRRPARPARRISTRLLRSELRLVFRRRRNLAMLAVLSTGPILGLAINAAGPSPGEGPPFFAQVTQNGLFLGLASVLVALPLFLPLAVSVVSGEAVAGEASTGTPETSWSSPPAERGCSWSSTSESSRSRWPARRPSSGSAS